MTSSGLVETAAVAWESNVVSPSVEDILACQLSQWYETFRSLPRDSFSRKAVTVKSIILDVPPLFVDYLKCDGVRLPIEATNVSSYFSANNDDDDSWVEEEKEDEGANQEFSFPELTEKIQAAIDSLGGTVMVKLNWSCPKDATWINNGSLKCKTPGDVFLLLKSSDFIMHDLLHAFDDSVGDKPTHHPYTLVLRQWCNFNPSMEFRCFVWNRHVLAISQRNHTQHFPHLENDKMLYVSLILDFFDEYVSENFHSNKYCFDVYIDQRERVWLVDFNVWGQQTDALLFTWEELGRNTCQTRDEHKPEIRIVETIHEIQPDPLASYRAPIDTVNLASMSGLDAKEFKEFMAKCNKPSEEVDDTD